jgi:hypothetical protein
VDISNCSGWRLQPQENYVEVRGKVGGMMRSNFVGPDAYHPRRAGIGIAATTGTKASESWCRLAVMTRGQHTVTSAWLRRIVADVDNSADQCRAAAT